jgi:predicted ATPase/DNA-binding XRE family transcriptional regulator
MSESTDSFGEVLQRLRSAAALSQEELAERAGLSRRGISDLERGRRRFPRLETVRLLADGLALTGDDRAALIAAARPALGTHSPADRESPLPSSLPAPLTRLIGREADVAALRAALRDDAVRWLTLVGPGGVGKTRLAVEVARGLRESFPAGVVFVDLTPAAIALLVVPAIAGALGVRETPGRPLVETLAAAIGAKRLLLVLDNCERVLAAAPEIATLLAASPNLTVFATSREPFHDQGEREFEVLPLPLPLPLPAAHQRSTVDSAIGAPAVTLFVERATATRRDFSVTAENVASVVGICGALDGLPLAIELAAARVKVLPPAALLARLERRLPLLTGGGHDLPARQRTMRDAIAWSYDLLSPKEQALFRRLAVFAAGCTLDAAEAVAADDGAAGVFAGMVALVEQSLLRPVDDGDGDPRFLMLETIREFGQEQLAARGEHETIGRRHAEWAVALVERVQRAGGLSQGRGLAAVEAEHPNLRAALAWLLDHDAATAALHLAGLLSEFWLRHGYLTEGTAWLERVLAADRGGPSTARVEALVGLNKLQWLLGDYERAAQLLAEAETVATAAGDDWAWALARLNQGYVAILRDDLELAESRGEDAAASFAAMGDVVHLDGALWMLALTALKRGDFVLAKARYERLLAEAASWNDEISIFNGHLGLAYLAEQDGETGRALASYAEAAAIGHGFGDSWAVSHVLDGAAAAAVAGGRFEEAVRLFAAADALRREVQAAPIPAFLIGRAGKQRARRTARAALGKSRFAAAWAAGAALSREAAVAEAQALSG